jgi:glycopeptide antibiotics resistance protein
MAVARADEPGAAGSKSGFSMTRIRVVKGWQGVMLAGMTCLILAITLFVEGRRPAGTNLAPFEDLGRLLIHAHRGELLSARFLIGALGIAGNLFLFVPWGFLTWKFLDGPGRTPLLLHLEVLFFGLLLSTGIELVQLFLPTRAADIDDVIWNVVGTFVGAALAHVGRGIEFEWE